MTEYRFCYIIRTTFHIGIELLKRGKIIGTHERKQRELAERKQLILDKSKELFFLHGFENVSIQDICNAIEYGKSAVYNIFNSKEEIYGYVYVEGVKILADLLNKVDIINSDPCSALQVFTKEVFHFYDEYNSYYKALFFFSSNHVACSKIPEYLLNMKLKEKERAMQPVRNLMQIGIKNNKLRDFDVDYLIDTYFASILGIINSFMMEMEDEGHESLFTMLINHAKIYERGLLL